MNRVLGGIPVLVLGLVATAQDPHQDESTTPAEEYRVLLREFKRAASTGRPLSDEERMEFVGHAYRLRSSLALKFVELAERYPADPIAFEALGQAVWQVNTTPWPVELVGEDAARVRAFELLQRDHIESDELGPVCQRLSYGFCAEYETFLRAVLELNPHRVVKAQACLALARFLSHRSQRLELIEDRPAEIQEFEDLFGAAYIEILRRRDHAEVIRESEALFERTAKEFGNVDVPGAGTVGEQAEAGLFELRYLVVGRSAAEIEGEDQHGIRFKLSDYRGKVVLLDFWSQY